MSALRVTVKITALIALAAGCVGLVALVQMARSIECRMGPGIYDFVAPLAGRYDLWRTSSHNSVIVLRHDPKNPSRASGTVVPRDVWYVGVHGDLITVCQCIVPDLNRVPVEEDFRYWIIHVRDEEASGPLAKADFETKCKELGADSSLKSMEIVDFYRK